MRLGHTFGLTSSGKTGRGGSYSQVIINELRADKPRTFFSPTGRLRSPYFTSGRTHQALGAVKWTKFFHDCYYLWGIRSFNTCKEFGHNPLNAEVILFMTVYSHRSCSISALSVEVTIVLTSLITYIITDLYIWIYCPNSLMHSSLNYYQLCFYFVLGATSDVGLLVASPKKVSAA